MDSSLIDYSAATLRVTLPQAARVEDARKGTLVLGAVAVLKPNRSNDLKVIVQAAQHARGKLLKKIPAVHAGDFGIITRTVMRAWLPKAIIGFQDRDGQDLHYAVDYMLSRMHYGSMLKVFYLAAAFSRGSALVATSYKCENEDCGKTTIFDLDPSQSMEDAEPERQPMEDMLRHLTETRETESTATFSYIFEKPVMLEQLGGETVPMKSVEVNWLTNEDYRKVDEDPVCSDYPELRAIYKNIYKINDLTPEQSRMLAENNGYDRTMSIFMKDAQGLLDEANKYAPDFAPHDRACIHCGQTGGTVDGTNFFAGLMTPK